MNTAVRALTVSTDDAAEAAAVTTTETLENVQSLLGKLNLPTWLGRVVIIIVTAVVMMIAVKAVSKAFRRTMDAMEEAGNSNVTLLSFVRYIVIFAIYFAGGVLIVSCIPGATDSLNALLASGGIVAVVIGLASQDALSNIAGGVMILAFKPFGIGDYVRYIDANVSGTVEDISLRHTAIRTPENKRLIIPNGKINEAVIENANYSDARVCEFLDISITYESDLKRAIDILREEVMKQPLHLDVRDPETEMEEPEVKVEVTELADSAVVIRAWLWAENVSSSFKLKFALNFAVKQRFDAEGIEFAYPHLTITQ